MRIARILSSPCQDRSGGHAPDIVIGPEVKEMDYRTLARLESPSITLSNESMDLLWLSAGLLRLEELANRNPSDVYGELEIVVSDSNPWSDVNDPIEELLELVLGMRVKVRVIEGKRSPMVEGQLPAKARSVVLFSGGVDSLAGILLARQKNESLVGVYVSHMSGVTGIVKRFESGVLREMRVPVLEFRLQQTRRMLHQLRGFAYLISGIVAAKSVGAATLDVTECGVTMYQPTILANDVVTMTTHPRLIELTLMIARRVLGRVPLVVRPFEDLTKAEVMALCPEPALLARTHSCVSSQFSYALSSHCGTCWGCLIKEASALVAGVGQPGWAKDVLRLDIGTEAGRRSGEKVTERSISDLLLLLDFSRHCLEDKLPWWTQSKIDEFGKGELFRRFALDIYSSLHIVYGEGNTLARNRYAAKAYGEAIRKGLVTKDILENRIAEVRQKKWRPDFEWPSRAANGL